MKFNKYFLFIIIIAEISALSHNQPDLCVNAQWDSTGVTFINSTDLGTRIRGVFIDSDDHFYALQSRGTQISIWSLKSLSSHATTISLGNTSDYSSPFVTEVKDLYYESDQQPGRIIKLSLNSTNHVTVAQFNGSCYGLFIDMNNTLYCSLFNEHRIDIKSLNDTSATIVTRAGNSVSGSSNYQLSNPCGIFVDTNFDLYVADSNNQRVQVFRSGNSNGKTIIGPGTHGSFSLSYPTDVILDKKSNMYVADSRNHRIIRVTPIGFECIASCTGASGSAANQVNIAYSLRFDSFGNLFVVDEYNYRAQKFVLISRCRTSYHRPQLCWNATWNPSAVTFVDSSILQTEARGIFIDQDDTFYCSRQSPYNDILRWMRGRNSSNSNRIMSTPMSGYGPLFVTLEKDIYFEVSSAAGRIEKRSVNSTSNAFVFKFSSECRGLFIDLNNTLYCSIYFQHRVDSIWLKDSNPIVITRAENGTSGSAINQLNGPWGIFVDSNFDMYVAEERNHRIQHFQVGSSNGTTVAGWGFPNNLSLVCPTDVIVDANGYIYVADNGHHRIIRVSSSAYQCLLGCDGTWGSSPTQLSLAYSLRFDSSGNIFVADEFNNRIQKLLLLSNCEEQSTTSIDTTSISTITYPMTEITTSAETTTTVNNLTTSSMIQPNPSAFNPTSCSDPLKTGTFCNLTNTPCEVLKPCLNNGSCFNDMNTTRGYFCSCPNAFTGFNCQFDHQFCSSKICLNDGTCQRLTNGTYSCLCAPGWEGSACEKRLNYCANVTCENRGVCRSHLSTYECLCLGESYSGRHCEIVSKKTTILRHVASSISFTMILIIGVFILFIVIMDVLKYVFGIDPAKVEEKDKRPRQRHRRPKYSQIIHYTYVNRPASE